MWHDSIGDIAIQQVMVEQLALRGVPSIPVSVPSGERTCVIGGGAIIQSSDDGVFGNALAPYKAKGRHVLNSVSVVDNGNYSFLKDYRYVSARDVPSGDRLKKYHNSVVLTPCPVVLMAKPDLNYHRKLPTYGFLDRQIENGPFYVSDVGVKHDDKERDVIRVDTRPWYERGAEPAFKHRNPIALASVVLAADYAICTSLHLSIICMGMGTPFVYLEPSDGKGLAYWSRAGAKSFVVKSLDGWDCRSLNRGQHAEIREHEISKATRHVDNICESLEAP